MAAQGKRIVYSHKNIEPAFFLVLNVDSVGDFKALSANDQYNTLINTFPILTKDNVSRRDIETVLYPKNIITSSAMSLTVIYIIIKSPNGVTLFKYTPERVGIDHGHHGAVPMQTAGSKHKSKRHTRRRKHTRR
jgi:hypothetical protein